MSKSLTVAIDSHQVASVQPTKKFEYHHGALVTSLDFDGLGQFLISAGVDRLIQLYDVHKGGHVRDVQSQKYGAHLARFTHQGLNCLYVSTANNDESNQDTHQIRLLNLENKQYVRYFKGHHHQVIQLAVNPVHDRFMLALIDGRVKLWDLRTSHDIGAVSVESARVLGYDPLGQVMAVALESTVRLFDPRQCERGPFLLAPLDIKQPVLLEFSNTGKSLLISTATGSHAVVDAFTGDVLTKLLVPGSNYSRFNYPTVPATWSPCGKFVVASSSIPAKLHVFDLTKLKTLDGGIHHVRENAEVTHPYASIASPVIPKVLAFDPKLMVLALADNSVVLWQPVAE